MTKPNEQEDLKLTGGEIGALVTGAALTLSMVEPDGPIPSGITKEQKEEKIRQIYSGAIKLIYSMTDSPPLRKLAVAKFEAELEVLRTRVESSRDKR